MSKDRCSKCSALVDTDDEPEAYVEIGNMRAQTETVCMCRSCRERHEEQQDREPRMPPDWQPTAAQQATIDQYEAEADPEGAPCHDRRENQRNPCARSNR